MRIVQQPTELAAHDDEQQWSGTAVQTRPPTCWQNRSEYSSSSSVCCCCSSRLKPCSKLSTARSPAGGGRRRVRAAAPGRRVCGAATGCLRAAGAMLRLGGLLGGRLAAPASCWVQDSARHGAGMAARAWKREGSLFKSAASALRKQCTDLEPLQRRRLHGHPAVAGFDARHALHRSICMAH